MKKWSKINIRLLTEDKCLNIMWIAFTILDGLRTYWSTLLSPIEWPNDVRGRIPLLLAKIYFNTEFTVDIEDLINYFDLPLETILTIITKTITKSNDHTQNKLMFDSIQLDFLDNADEKQTKFITKTLRSFDNIVRTATLTVREKNVNKLRQTEASQKLTIKLNTERLSSATIATATAINKALETVNNQQNEDQAT